MGLEFVQVVRMGMPLQMKVREVTSERAASRSAVPSAPPSLLLPVVCPHASSPALLLLLLVLVLVLVLEVLVVVLLLLLRGYSSLQLLVVHAAPPSRVPSGVCVSKRPLITNTIN